MQQQHQRQAGRQPCHQSVQFSSVEFSSVQFSSAAAAAQIASDMSLFIGNSINCRSSSTGVSTIESTAAVQFSSVRSIMTIVPNRFPASAPTRSNLIRHTTVNMSPAQACPFMSWCLYFPMLMRPHHARAMQTMPAPAQESAQPGLNLFRF